MKSLVESGAVTQHASTVRSRSWRLIIAGSVLWVVWPGSMLAATTVPSNLGVWGLPVSIFFFVGVPFATALIAAGWSGLVHRSARWSSGVGFLLGIILWPGFLVAYTSLGVDSTLVVGLSVLAVPVSAGLIGSLVGERLGYSIPRSSAVGALGAISALAWMSNIDWARAFSVAIVAGGIVLATNIGPKLFAAWKQASKVRTEFAATDRPKNRTLAVTLRPIAMVVLGISVLLFGLAVLLSFSAGTIDRFCTLESPLTDLPTGMSLGRDPVNDCAWTLFVDGKPAPASVYEEMGGSYPGPRPLAFGDYAFVFLVLVAFAGGSLVVVGAKGIRSTRDPNRGRF